MKKVQLYTLVGTLLATSAMASPASIRSHVIAGSPAKIVGTAKPELKPGNNHGKVMGTKKARKIRKVSLRKARAHRRAAQKRQPKAARLG